MKKKNIVNNTFYLTGLFSHIKTDHNWTTNETKMVLLLFQKLSKHRLYIPDFDKLDNGYEMLMNDISNIPLNYSFTKKDFESITNVQGPHLSREIKKVIKGLLSKVIIMPSPIEKHNSNSISGSTWFSKIDYLDGKGVIDIEINKHSIEKLVALISYSRIRFENIIKIQNHNAIHSYLLFKILRDYHKFTALEIPIDEFKEKLGLKDKYKITKTFKDKVLDVVKREIDSHTDFDIEYELIKEGKGYTKIKFTFDYKAEFIEQKKNKPTKVNNKEKHLLDNGTTGQYTEESSPFEQTLVGWGIRAKKVVEIEETYSLDAISKSIDETIKAELGHKIKLTKASFFLGVLENKQKSGDEMFEREQVNAHEHQEKELQTALGVEYDAIQTLINDNEDEISTYLSVSSAGSIYELGDDLNEQLKSLSYIDANKFVGFRPRLAVLDKGFFDMNTKKEVRPNMSDFLKLLM